MPYNSPFQMLGLDISSEINRSTLNLARRKMFAEIDLSTTQTLVRGDKELTKDDVIRLFDSLEKNQNLEYHRLIAKDDALRYFLETNSVKRERQSKKHRYVLETFADEPSYQDPNFIAFVSPYYTESWAKTVLNCLERQDSNDLKDVFEKLPKLMTHDAEASVWAKVENYLYPKIERLSQILSGAENGRYYELTTLHEVTHVNLMRCLNLLPSSFWSIRESFAVKIHNLAVVYLNKGNTTYANYAVKQALVLECSGEMKQNLEEVQRVVSTLIQREAYTAPQYSSSSSSNNDSGGCALQALFIIFLFVIRFACDGTSNSRHIPSYPKVEYPAIEYPREYPPPSVSNEIVVKGKKKKSSDDSRLLNEVEVKAKRRNASDNSPLLNSKAKLREIYRKILERDGQKQYTDEEIDRFIDIITKSYDKKRD